MSGDLKMPSPQLIDGVNLLQSQCQRLMQRDPSRIMRRSLNGQNQVQKGTFGGSDQNESATFAVMQQFLSLQ